MIHASRHVSVVGRPTDRISQCARHPLGILTESTANIVVAATRFRPQDTQAHDTCADDPRAGSAQIYGLHCCCTGPASGCAALDSMCSVMYVMYDDGIAPPRVLCRACGWRAVRKYALES